MLESNQGLLLPAGSAVAGPDPVAITPERAGWAYSGLRVMRLAPGETRTVATGSSEGAVLPLTGGAIVTIDGEWFELTGRPSVFSRVSDFVYVPRDSELTLTAPDGGEFALTLAVAGERRAAAYVPAADVEVGVRGAGRASRQVVNFLMAGVPLAQKLLAVEVITPAGNFSSYPPHKHDTFDPGAPEVELEEIYYFRFSGENGYGIFREWSPDGAFDLTTVVRDHDVALCPRGYHGPTIAVPGHHMYFLNVMAGPGTERVWQATDAPEEAWVREMWPQLEQDPRLPLTSAEEPAS
jgi:5-deoxy-glucuronate isomerase